MEPRLGKRKRYPPVWSWMCYKITFYSNTSLIQRCSQKHRIDWIYLINWSSIYFQKYWKLSVTLNTKLNPFYLTSMHCYAMLAVLFTFSFLWISSISSCYIIIIFMYSVYKSIPSPLNIHTYLKKKNTK